MKLAFFDTKPYDKPGFDEHAAGTDIEIKYFETRLGEDTVQLAKGFDGVCVFVNDTVNEKVAGELYDLGVRVVALRCAGFNNVDTKACFGKLHVFRVPAYSPYAVAEHAMALLLTVNRHTNKAYIRTRDFNFSLSGLTGFDLHGKTVGVIGTGKIARIVIRILLGNLASGQVMALLYSLGGGLLSFAGMALLCRILTAKQVWAAGAAGGLLHNLGQMAVALAVTQTPGLLIWLPVLLLCGLVTGLFTGLCAQLLLRRRLISDKGDTHDESQKK